jgi:hypothetical protein
LEDATRLDHVRAGGEKAKKLRKEEEEWRALEAALHEQYGTPVIGKDFHKRSRGAAAAILADLDASLRRATSPPQLTNDPVDRTLAKLFELGKLDPGELDHWALIARILAIGIFHPPKAGRTREWDSERYCQLLADHHQVSERNQKLRDTAICAFLTRSPAFKGRYSGIKPGELKKRLNAARDPQQNGLLAKTIEAMRSKADGGPNPATRNEATIHIARLWNSEEGQIQVRFPEVFIFPPTGFDRDNRG